MKRSIINSQLLRFDGYVFGTRYRRYVYTGKNMKCYLIPTSSSLQNLKDYEVSKNVYLSTFKSENFN